MRADNARSCLMRRLPGMAPIPGCRLRRAGATRAGACLLLFLLPLALPSGSEAASAPVLHGTVVNTSATPRRPVAGIVVELQVRWNGHTLAVVRGRTDGRGTFALVAPPLPRGAGYTVVATYMRVAYDVAISAADLAHPIQVKVYDVTSTDSAVVAMRVVIGVRRVGKQLRVIEQWPFTNAGVRTVVGSDPASGHGAAGFALPPHATHVVVSDVQPAPATTEIRGDRVLVNAVIRPATGLNAASLHQVTFTFDVPVESGRPTLLIPTRYFVGSLYVFTVGSHLVAPGFKASTLPVGGQRIPALERDAVPPGSTLAVGVGGPPAVASSLATAPAAPTSAPVAPAPFPTATVVMLTEAGFVLLLLVALRGRVPALTSTRGRLELQRERARLVGAIAELDLQRADGRIAEDEYRRRRSSEKGRLLGVSRRLGE